MTDNYILIGKEPVPCSNLTKWARWMESANRIVKLTLIADVRISTVFLGLNHRFLTYGDRTPILFETLVFGGPHDGDMERYCTWDEAEEGHERMVKVVNGGSDEI